MLGKKYTESIVAHATIKQRNLCDVIIIAIHATTTVQSSRTLGEMCGLMKSPPHSQKNNQMQTCTPSYLPIVAATRGTLSMMAENTPITAKRYKKRQEERGEKDRDRDCGAIKSALEEWNEGS